MNYYRRYIGDYQRDTMHLSLVEHGAFAMLLDSYYAQDGRLPQTHQVLFRLCRAITQEEMEAVARVADEFFPVGPDGVRDNARAQRELAAALPRILAARLNGKKGGRPAESEPNRIILDNPLGIQEVTQPVSSPSSTPQPPAFNLQPSTKDKGTSKPKAAALARLSWLPPWIPEEPWKGWLEMRVKKHVPNTDRAMRLAISKLDTLRAAGEDLAGVIDQSTVSGWTKFYPVSLDRAGKGNSVADYNRASAAEALRRMQAEHPPEKTINDTD